MKDPHQKQNSKHRTKTKKSEKEHLVPALSAKLPTGQLIETLYRPEVPETCFALYQADTWGELGKVPAPDGGWYVPYSPKNNLITHRVLLLPSAVEEYHSEALLQALVQGFVHRYVDVSPDFERLATAYVFLSWHFDDFPELPYLRVQGDFGSGKSRFLQTVGSLMYKPIFASGASTTSPLFRLLDSVRGTLILDESDFRFSDEKAEIVKILNNGNQKGFPVLRSVATPSGEYNPRAFDVFGPKVIATRGPFDDRALESRCITEVMTGRKIRSDIPKSLPSYFHEEARSLRNKLLLYRFRHAGLLVDLDESIPGVAPRVSQVFAPLLAIADHADRPHFERAAQAHDNRLRGFRAATAEAEVLRVLLPLLKRPGLPLTMKSIAAAYNRAHGTQVSPRWVGSLVRRKLFLEPVLLNGRFVLPATARQAVLERAVRYGLELGDVGDVGDVGVGG